MPLVVVAKKNIEKKKPVSGNSRPSAGELSWASLCGSWSLRSQPDTRALFQSARTALPAPSVALEPRFLYLARTCRSRMIASHMIACLFTELNQNQVQKVSRHGRELLARFGPSCVLSGNLEHAEDLLPPPLGLGTWNQSE